MLAIAVVVVACSRSDRDEADRILGDRTRATPAALEQAARAIWHDTKAVRHSFRIEPRGDEWRLFVTADRVEQPTIEQRNGGVELRFHRALDGAEVARQSSMLRAGIDRKLAEVLVAQRYRVEVLGVTQVIVEPTRTSRNDGLQSFNQWSDTDMETLAPYDLVMNKTGTVRLQRGQ